MGKRKRNIQCFAKKICLVDLLRRVANKVPITNPYERRYIQAHNKQLARRQRVGTFVGHR
jgi:hypothetical protein